MLNTYQNVFLCHDISFPSCFDFYTIIQKKCRHEQYVARTAYLPLSCA